MFSLLQQYYFSILNAVDPSWKYYDQYMLVVNDIAVTFIFTKISYTKCIYIYIYIYTHACTCTETLWCKLSMRKLWPIMYVVVIVRNMYCKTYLFVVWWLCLDNICYLRNELSICSKWYSESFVCRRALYYIDFSTNFHC